MTQQFKFSKDEVLQAVMAAVPNHDEIDLQASLILDDDGYPTGGVLVEEISNSEPSESVCP